jgi:hypothetical protein
MAENHVSVHQIYHIRVKGHPDEKWADGFDGFVMVPRANGETLLTGSVADQAALYGILDRIRDLDVPLLLLAQTGCPCPKRCPRHGLCQECTAYHGAKGKLGYCARSKTRWDRQWAALVETR